MRRRNFGEIEFAAYCCGEGLAGGADGGLAGGADGVAGFVSGDVVPEPVVAGGVTLRTGALFPVVIGGVLLFAAVFSVVLLFQPARTTKAIRATTAKPAIHPQTPPLWSRTGAGWM